MKQHIVSIFAGSFAIIAFTFTLQGSSKKMLGCENVYWFVVSGTSTSDPDIAKAFAVPVDDLTDDNNPSNDYFIIPMCENDDLPVCAIGYPATSLRRVLKTGSLSDYEWRPGVESVPLCSYKNYALIYRILKQVDARFSSTNSAPTSKSSSKSQRRYHFSTVAIPTENNFWFQRGAFCQRALEKG